MMGQPSRQHKRSIIESTEEGVPVGKLPHLASHGPLSEERGDPIAVRKNPTQENTPYKPNSLFQK